VIPNPFRRNAGKYGALRVADVGIREATLQKARRYEVYDHSGKSIS
jgi:hypothetical protein